MGLRHRRYPDALSPGFDDFLFLGAILRLNIEPNTKGTNSNVENHVLASCKVELTSEDGTDVVCILDARVLRNRSGELWVGYHSQSLSDLDGSQRYVPTIEFSKNLTRRISDAVLVEYECYRASEMRSVGGYDGRR